MKTWVSALVIAVLLAGMYIVEAALLGNSRAPLDLAIFVLTFGAGCFALFCLTIGRSRVEDEEVRKLRLVRLTRALSSLIAFIGIAALLGFWFASDGHADLVRTQRAMSFIVGALTVTMAALHRQD